MLEDYINQVNSDIEQIIAGLNNNLELKSIIATIKENMFNNNTHGWKELKESTKRRKYYYAKSGKIPSENIDKPNIRSTDLRDAFANEANITIKDNLSISFELNNYQEHKLKTVQDWGRDPIEITDEEFNQIIDYVINVIVNKMNELYAYN